jgi:uncharacterized protein YndB with AHSA1/START domain
MIVQSVQQTIRIRAKPSDVWNALVNPASLERWMSGARVDASCEPGSPITFTGMLHGRPYHDRGTVLRCDPERLLRFNHWSVLSHLPDSEPTRTIISFTLTPEGAETDLEVKHDNLRGKAAYGHARFFWRNALPEIRSIAEGAAGR